MKKSLVTIMERNFLSCLQMLDETIDCCPNELWVEIHSGYPFWQQIYHVLEGVDFWFRDEYEKVYEENPVRVWETQKNVSYDLNETRRIFEETLTKEELRDYLASVLDKTTRFFEGLDDKALERPIVAGEEEFTYLDVIDMQLRHVMYHVGYCMCILRGNDAPTVGWISHNERDE